MNNRKSKYKTIISICALFLILGICFLLISFTGKFSRDEQVNEVFHSFCENKSLIQDFEREEECVKEYEDKYIITLKRYIYDGISAYAVFSIKNKDNSVQDLNKFGLSSPDQMETYYFGNSRQKNLYEEEVINSNEKLIFINSILLNTQSDENNNLSLVDNMDNSEKLSFPLKISTDYFEVKEENFMVRVSPIQIFFMSTKKNTMSDITVMYEDGDQNELLKNYNIVGGFLGDCKIRNNEDGVVMYHSILKGIDFDNIKKIEVKLSTGITAVLERVKNTGV